MDWITREATEIKQHPNMKWTRKFLSKLWKTLMHSLKKRRQHAFSKNINILPSWQQEFLPSVVTPHSAIKLGGHPSIF
jgi:hypothetical protein